MYAFDIDGYDVRDFCWKESYSIDVSAHPSLLIRCSSENILFRSFSCLWEKKASGR